MRINSAAALANGSGEMAALTQVYVDPDQANWGYQGLTAVTEAPWTPAGNAGQDRDAAATQRTRSPDQRGRDRQRSIEQVHDRGE